MAAWSLTLYPEFCVLSLITDKTYDSNGVLARRIFSPRRELNINHEGSVGGSQSSERFSKTGGHPPFGKGLPAVAISCKALFFVFFLFFYSSFCAFRTWDCHKQTHESTRTSDTKDMRFRRASTRSDVLHYFLLVVFPPSQVDEILGTLCKNTSLTCIRRK